MQLADATARQWTADEYDEPRVAGPARLLTELKAAGSGSGSGAVSLVDHRRGYPVPPRPRRGPNQELIALIGRSGLAGRGGAGFPTARKLHAVAEARGPAVIVVNGAEGEPASGKDRILLRRLPHLVLDGALVAAAAVGADLVIVCVDRTNARARDAISQAVAERLSHHEGAIAIEVAGTPPRYVAGESSALVHWLNNGPAQPTNTKPRDRGVGGRPTLVQNAETMAHLAQIFRFGPEWFRQTGTDAEPGTVLVTVSGAVVRPSIIETAMGTPIELILAAAGGVVGRPRALLIGGFFGSWAPLQEARDAAFSSAGLTHLGAQPGAGILIVLPEGACGLAETARIMAWYAAESAGQCGPCLYGLADLAAGAASLANSGAEVPAGAQVAQLRRWSAQIEGRGACHHPDGAVNLLRSALRVFAEDLGRHERGWPCPGAAGPPALNVPTAQQGWR